MDAISCYYIARLLVLVNCTMLIWPKSDSTDLDTVLKWMANVTVMESLCYLSSAHKEKCEGEGQAGVLSITQLNPLAC